MPDADIRDRLELMRSEAKRVERSARILKQMAAQALDAMAAHTNDSPKEDTRERNDQDHLEKG
jgi:hypothetical protein